MNYQIRGIFFKKLNNVTYQATTGGRPKMPLFWVKIDHDARLPYQTNNPSGNWKMGQNTPQAMGKDVLDTFMPHPGAIPRPGWSKNGYFWG